jgi:RNA polymerase sigma factor (TIGR02999 family)
LKPRPGYHITDLLSRWSDGDSSARDALIPLVYDDLRGIARRKLAQERIDHTLQPTALVHEAYLRLSNGKKISWQGRTHFFALAAQIMREILVDHARANRAAKRGGGAYTLALEEVEGFAKDTNLDLIDLDDAMKKLATLDSRQCQIVELRFFAGLSLEEAAEVVDVSPTTAKRYWATARLFLLHAMEIEA